VEDAKGTVERVGGYRVVRRLATGGTSDVLLAKAEGPHGFERTVVLKLLLSQYRNDEELAKMFAREAAAYARLSHPAIVQLYDFFQLDGQLVMVLEYVDGAPLSRLRGMLKAVGQNIDDKSALFIAQRIFSALAAAHESTGDSGTPTPVVHRDVNPTNVLVPWDGQVKLADFGIAKVTGVTHESAAGLIKGTYGYMAPEQVEGGAITARADVYAAGIILWELLTRRRAFQRGALPEIEVLRAMAEPRITSIDILRPDVDRKVRAAINRALVPQADKRNITAEEMVAILKEAVSPEEGRERLAALLALVRHEPKPVNTSMPPPHTDPMPGAPKPGALKSPKPMAPPRPASVPRMPAAIGPPTTKRTASGPLPAVTAPPKVSTKTAQGIGSERAFATTQQSAQHPRADESAPQLVEEPMRESERMRLATPLAAIAPGKSLKDAIDEILTSVPSSIPPSVLSSRVPPKIEAKPAYPPSSAPPPAPLTPRMIALPPTPLLNVTMPLGHPSPVITTAPPGATKPAPPIPNEPALPSAPPLVSDPPAIGAAIAEALQLAPIDPSRPFDQTLREIERAEQLTVTPPAANASSLPNLNMPEPGEPPDERTVAIDHQANVITSKVHSYDPAGAAAQHQRPPQGYGQMAPAALASPGSSSPPIATTGSHDALLPQPKPSSVGVIAFMIVLTVAAGVAGTVFYMRHQKAKEAATHPPAVASSAPTSTTSVVAPFVPPSATPPVASASVSASASAPASAPAASESAAPSAVVSAPPSASVAPTAGEIPAGMGVIHTTGAAANRRIFVDEKTVGQTPESVTVKCGTRAVRLGSSGKTQTIDIPCGGEITVADKN
jgi:eukaryotic-like serine/threonine-protein kinase